MDAVLQAGAYINRRDVRPWLASFTWCPPVKRPSSVFEYLAATSKLLQNNGERDMYEFVEYRVADVMTPRPLVIGPRTRLADAETIFEEHDFNGLPVVEAGGELVGMLTKLDLLKAFAFNPRAVIPAYDEIMCEPAERMMTRTPLTVELDAPLTRVLHTMIATRHKSLPVVEGDLLVGIIAREDVLRALRRAVTGERPSRSSAPPCRRHPENNHAISEPGSRMGT